MNILSLDGDGVRGIIQLLILKEIIRRVEAKLHRPVEVVDLFDFYAGSSIGTVIIAGLLTPNSEGRPRYTIDDLIAKIKNGANQMFKVSVYENLKTVWGWRAPKYSDDKRPSVFSDLFGDLQFKNLLKPVIFPCGDDLNDRPLYFQNQQSQYQELLVRDILMGTTAAPTYFPSKNLTIEGQKCNLIDSGCVVNDTSSLAFLEGLQLMKENSESLYEVSIGTGLATYPANSQGWGLMQWIPNLINTFMSFGASYDEFQLSLVSKPEQRDRLNPPIPSKLSYLDRPEYIDQYINLTTRWMEDYTSTIDEVVSRLLQAKPNLIKYH